MSAAERRAAATVARILSAALDAPAIRQQLKNAMAASAAVESKLHWTSFLSGRGDFITASLPTTGTNSADDLRSAIAAVRDLEIYMPVRAHRDRWNGDGAVLVTVALTEEVSPTAFRGDGSSYVLSRVHAPIDPVVVLAPVETRLELQAIRNARGEPEIRCDPDASESLTDAIERCRRVRPHRPLAHVSADSLEGFYMTHVEFSADECGKECWFWGDPEFEIHTLSNNFSTGQPTVSTCAAAHSNSSRADYYDQNQRSWAGKVRILNKAEWETIATYSDSTFGVIFVEDDNVQCEIIMRNSLDDLLDVAMSGYTTTLLMAVGASQVAMASALVTVVDLIDYVLDNGDDFIGVAQVEVNSTHNIVIRGIADYTSSRVAGRATIKPYSATGPYIGPVATVKVSPLGDNGYMPVGSGVQMVAYGIDAFGTPVPGASIAWSSSNANVPVSSSGWLSANAEGAATITATINGISAQAFVSAVPYGPVASVRVSPASVSLDGGDQEQLFVRLYDANDFELPIATGPIIWNSADEAVCTIDPSSNIVTGHGSPYWTTFTATVEDLTSDAVPCSVDDGGAMLRAPSERTIRASIKRHQRPLSRQ